VQDRSGSGPLLLALSAALAGCATWSQHGLIVQLPSRLRVAVIESGKLDPARDARSRFELRLSSAAEFEVTPDSETDEALAANGLSAPLTPQGARYLGRVLGVQGIVALDVLTYGKPSPGLLTAAVGIRTAEAGAAGWALAKLWVPWAGAGLAIFDEGLALSEWTLGAPVVIRAALWSAADGGKVWGRTASAFFGRSADKAVDKLSKGLEKAARRNSR
jgi:hypothetical protein